MFFNISSTQENECKWDIQHERIKQAKTRIGNTRYMELKELEMAL
jgi:hypothetical protein